ncbi:unnamed protein product [Paramecium octaurelia]|uniref:Uncharacterized protein n=1 Tax=Paramecium octaurelia TaxID=43137 RepID=A0A8S1VP76_PAROT|nr:unnamed protein product [Paramecium octaurelia]
MNFLEKIRSGILAIKKIAENQEIHQICDRLMDTLRLQDYPKYLDRIVLQDVRIEHLQNQCNFLKNLKKINENEQVFNILLKNEEETYRLNKCVQELQQNNENLMKQIYTYERMLNVLNQNQDDQIYHLNKIKEQSMEIVQLKMKLQDQENVLSNPSQLKKQIKLLESKKK